MSERFRADHAALASRRETREARSVPRSAAAILIALSACRIEVGPPGAKCETSESTGALGGEVMIYTSMYRPVTEAVDRLLEAKLPAVRVEWLPLGSEKIATRLDAELAAGATSADLVMTSEPFWFERKKREGQVLAHAAIRALAMPRDFVDRDGAYVTSRFSTMVLAYNTRLVPEGEAPDSYAALFTAKWKKAVTIPDPLASGTAFTTLAFLVDRHGLEIIDHMKEAETVASGGNSAAMTRLIAGEQRVGFVLLENVLQSQRAGAPIGYRIPKEGAVLIPGPVAILERTDNAPAARAVYELLLSDEVQRAIIEGDLHSPFTELEAPKGAPPLDALMETEHRWSPDFLERALTRSDELRRKYSAVMGGT
jgi:iron(III) transport system substrate-binding protein